MIDRPFARLFFLASCVALATLVEARDASAAVRLVLPTTTAVSGTPNQFFDLMLEVDATTPGETPPIDLDSFFVEVFVDAASPVTFLGATTNTADPYVLEGNSFGFSAATSDGDRRISVSDLADMPPQTLGAGTFGVARIFFDVAPNALGEYAITIDTGASELVEFDPPSFPTLAFIAVGGSITVVPEPGPLSLAVTLAIASMMALRLRRGGEARLAALAAPAAPPLS